MDKPSAHCVQRYNPQDTVDVEGNPGERVLENSDQRFTSYRFRQCVITVNTPAFA